MFELYIPSFLASFGCADCSKGKPLGTVLFSFQWRIHWHELRNCGLSCSRVIALCLRHCGKADLSAYAFSVLICLYLHAGLRVKGPFVIQSLTSTNTVIKVKDDPNAEPINVSRQRISLCGYQMKNSSPWIGHSNKLRKRRKIHKPKIAANGAQTEEQDQTQAGDHTNTETDIVTRKGRKIRRPARYCSMTVPKCSQQKEEEEVVRTQEIPDENGEVT